ncbi:MAG TPA: permease prefix domain 1-containing protein [Thermomonospora sp.]|nr:permease prefix domain 1-containing protein [Thermomonospora sp.]
MTASADPIEEYVADLAATLRGPARLRERMITEVRDGLHDTAAAHADAGTPYPQAAREAVREFGPVTEIAPDFQRELTIVQTRHTARTLALTLALLIACWHLLWISEPGWPLPSGARVLTAPLATAAGAAVLVATVTLAATGTLARRLPTPDLLPRLVAWTGTATGVAIMISSVALILISLPAAGWAPPALAGTLAAAAHVVIAASARACRHCARHAPPP